MSVRQRYPAPQMTPAGYSAGYASLKACPICKGALAPEALPSGACARQVLQNAWCEILRCGASGCHRFLACGDLREVYPLHALSDGLYKRVCEASEATLRSALARFFRIGPWYQEAMDAFSATVEGRYDHRRTPPEYDTGQEEGEAVAFGKATRSDGMVARLEIRKLAARVLRETESGTIEQVAGETVDGYVLAWGPVEASVPHLEPTRFYIHLEEACQAAEGMFSRIDWTAASEGRAGRRCEALTPRPAADVPPKAP